MSVDVRIYTLWASLKGEEPSPWMIAAEDEFSWEGDPKRCEDKFKDARGDADGNGWDVREITLLVPSTSLYGAFEPLEVAARAARDDA